MGKGAGGFNRHRVREAPLEGPLPRAPVGIAWAWGKA